MKRIVSKKKAKIGIMHIAVGQKYVHCSKFPPVQTFAYGSRHAFSTESNHPDLLHVPNLRKNLDFENFFAKTSTWILP